MYFEHRWNLSRPGFTVLPANYRSGLAVEGTACVVGGNPVAVCEQPGLTCVRKPVLTCQDRLAMEIQRDPAGNPIMSGGSPVMGPPVLNLEVFVANNYGYCNLPMALPPPGFTVPYVLQGLGMLIATEYDGPPNYNYFGAATNALQFVW